MKRAPRLAVVDDRNDVTAVLRLGLEDHGFDVLTLGEPTSALEGLTAAAPDLICLGMATRQDASVGLYKELAHHPRLSGCPVVVLAGSAPERESVVALLAAAGAPAPAGILASPVDLDELVRTANALLGRPLGVAP